MFKKIIFALIYFCFSSGSFAESCPTPAELGSSQFQGWAAVDINNGTTVSYERLEQFKKEVARVALVEWMKDAPEGEAHCYYYNGINEDYLDIFLAKQGLKPDVRMAGWKVLDTETMQCRPMGGGCLFVVA